MAFARFLKGDVSEARSDLEELLKGGSGMKIMKKLWLRASLRQDYQMGQRRGDGLFRCALSATERAFFVDNLFAIYIQPTLGNIHWILSFVT